MILKEWYSAAELAGLGLPGFPSTKKGVLQLVDREKWPSKKREGKGGGSEYQPSKAIKKLISEKTLGAIVSGALKSDKPADIVVAKKTLMPTERLSHTGAVVIAGLNRRVKQEGDLTTVDRQRRDASLLICRAIDEAIAHSGWKARKVIIDLATRLMDGLASPELAEAASITYTKPRAGGQTHAALVSRLQKMYSAYDKGRSEGDVSMYLVPGQRQKEVYPAYLIKAFLIHYCHPNRPPVMTAWRASEQWFIDHGLERPAVDTFYRIEKALPVTIKYRGRITGSEWRSLLPYVSRDVSMFKANDIWVGDGHSFKAKVQHPIHGRPFVPEITVIRDWVSRKIVGWSVDMAESCIAVSAALRDAMLRTEARPLIYYSDNGSGQTAKQLDHPVHGVLSRLGVAHHTGIPGNPQGRGIIERLWSDTFIALAQTYPTFQGKSGDDNTINRMLKDLNKKEPTTLLPSWNQFLADVAAVVDEYNNRVHSVIKTTPNKHYIEKLDPDSIDIGVTSQEIASLWMPQVERVPDRGVIELFKNEYAMPELVNLLAEGERVVVRFDIHRPEKVMVFRLDGRYLGEAIWDGHKTSAFPVPYVEHKRQERVDRKVVSLQRKAADARGELGNTVDSEATQIFVIPPQAKPEPLVTPVIPRKEAQAEMSFLDVQRMLQQQGKNDDTDEVAVG
jgi:putative transposase